MNPDGQELVNFLRPANSGKDFLRAGAASFVLHILAALLAVAAGTMPSSPEKAPKASGLNVFYVTLPSSPASRISPSEGRAKGPESAASGDKKAEFPERNEKKAKPFAFSRNAEAIPEKALKPDSRVTAPAGTDPQAGRSEMTTLNVPADRTAPPPASGASGREQGSGTAFSKLTVQGSGKSEGVGTAPPSTASRYEQTSPPVYPQAARRKGYEGLVLISVEILEDGSPGRLLVKKSSGYEILDQAALQAIRKWKFVPAVQNHVRIRSWAVVPIRFVLQESN